MRATLSSLARFCLAGLRPRTPLARAIVFVLVVKLIGIAALRIYMAEGGAARVVDATAMAHVIGVVPPGH